MSGLENRVVTSLTVRLTDAQAEHLAFESASVAPAAEGRPFHWPPGRELLYVVDVAASRTAGVTLWPFTRDPAVRGGFLTPRTLGLTRENLARLPRAADRKALSLLAGARPAGATASWAESWEQIPSAFVLREGLAGLLLPDLCTEGRCVLRQGARSNAFVPVAWGRRPSLAARSRVREERRWGPRRPRLAPAR